MEENQIDRKRTLSITQENQMIENQALIWSDQLEQQKELSEKWMNENYAWYQLFLSTFGTISDWIDLRMFIYNTTIWYYLLANQQNTAPLKEQATVIPPFLFMLPPPEQFDNALEDARFNPPNLPSKPQDFPPQQIEDLIENLKICHNSLHVPFNIAPPSYE